MDMGKSVVDPVCRGVAYALAAFVALSTQGAVTQGPVAVDGVGSRATSGAKVMLTAGAQAGGVGLATAAGGAQHSAGFLHVFQLNSGQDTDGDGLANEVDPDNDADGLSDEREASGSSFSPTTATAVNDADTDADGASDSEEAVAGTDPTDPASHLHVIVGPFGPIVAEMGFEPDPPPGEGWTTDVQYVHGLLLRWPVRAGKTYTVSKTSDLKLGPFVPFYTNLAAGPGAGAWQVLTNHFIETNLITRGFYRIEVQP